MLISLIKLVRWPNLLIVFITQWIVWSHLINKTLSVHSTSSNLSTIQFLLLSLATILVAAAGYVINDIEDVKIDLINKPDKVIVGKKIFEQSARLFYKILIGAGFLLSLLLAWQLDKLPYMLLYPMFVLALHLYATHLKKTPLFGNVLISLFVAAVPMIIFLADAKQVFLIGDSRVFHILILYGLLAFLANLIREIVKDMQDVKGDKAFGSRSFPILFGFQNSKYLIYGLLLSVLLVLVAWTFVIDYAQQTRLAIFAGTSPLLIICIILIVTLTKISSENDFGRWSFGIKLFMLFGLLFLYLQSI